MSLDPKTVFKRAAARAAAATPNLIGGAVTLAASAVLWNPLPLLLWGVGAAGWVLYASTSQKYTRRVLDEERQATELAADQAREALRARIESMLARRPFADWLRAGVLPDYLRVFARLVAVRDRVTQLLAERREDYLAGLGIQSQLTYLLTSFLQFVQARLALLQTLVDFKPGPAGGGGAPDPEAEAEQQGAGQAAAALAARAADWQHGGSRERPPTSAGRPGAGAAAWRGAQAAKGRTAQSPPFASTFSTPPITPMTPITARAFPAGGRGGDAGGAAGRSGVPRSSSLAELPDVPALLGDLDGRMAALRELAQREPATAHTREWHIGILQKQQELLRDCANRDQQLVAQLTAVPDAFDVIAGRISAAQFDAAELAAYTGGVVEQIEETEKFVHAMRPVTDEEMRPAGSVGTGGSADQAGPPAGDAGTGGSGGVAAAHAVDGEGGDQRAPGGKVTS